MGKGFLDPFLKEKVYDQLGSLRRLKAASIQLAEWDAAVVARVLQNGLTFSQFATL